MTKVDPYEVLVDGLEIAVGDGPLFKFRKGTHSPKNEAEEQALIVAVHNGQAKPPKKSEGE